MHHRVKRIWNDFVAIFVGVSVIEGLLYVCYDDEGEVNTAVEATIWSVFVVDFLLTFFTSYEDCDGQTVTSHRSIAVHYLKGWLGPDLVAITPLMFVGMEKYQEYLQLLRVLKLKRTLDLIDGSWLSIGLRVYFRTASVDNVQKVKVIRKYSVLVLRQLAVVLFFTFLMGAFFFQFSNSAAERSAHSAFAEDRMRPHTSPLQKLLISWYYSTTTLASIGYGDLTPVNMQERLFVMAMIVVGMVVLSVVVAEFNGVIQDIDELQHPPHLDKALQTWFSECETLNKRISARLKLRINVHFQHYWSKDRLGSLACQWWRCSTAKELATSPDAFFAQLPAAEKRTIMQLLFGDLFFAYHRFFVNDEGFKYELALHLQPRLYLPGETILAEGEIPKEIYLHQSGVIHCGITDNSTFISFIAFAHKTVIGDLHIITECCSPLHYRVADSSSASAFAIPSRPFKVLLRQKPPKLQLKMLHFARMRFRKAKHALDAYMRELPYEDVLSTFAGTLASFVSDVQSPRATPSTAELRWRLAELQRQEKEETAEYHKKREALTTEIHKRMLALSALASRGLQQLCNKS